MKFQVTKPGVRNAQAGSLQILCLSPYDCIALISVSATSPFLFNPVPECTHHWSYAQLFYHLFPISQSQAQTPFFRENPKKPHLLISDLHLTRSCHHYWQSEMLETHMAKEHRKRLMPTSRANKWHYLGKGFSSCSPWTSGDFTWQSRLRGWLCLTACARLVQSVLGTKACRDDGPWQSSDKTTHVSKVLLLLNEWPDQGR